MVALSSISLQAVMLRMGHIHDHIMLMANQGGNWTSTVSSMLQKTAHVAYGTKTSQNQNHGHFT